MTVATTLTKNVITRAKAPGRIGSLRQLGFEVGRVDRLTLESSEGAHAQWKKADDATKKAFKAEFVIGYVASTLKVDYGIAETICAKKRVERSAKHEKAVNAAGYKFRYHVSREGVAGKRASGEQAAPKVRIATPQREAIFRLLDVFGDANEMGDKERIALAIKALQALKKRVK